MRTFSITGDTPILNVNYFPPIYLEENVKYELAFLSFESFNSIPNVDVDNNVLQIGNFNPIIIPPGNYELQDLADYLTSHVNENETHYANVWIKLKGNSNTLQSMIKCSHEIDFSVRNSIGHMLGFKSGTIKPSNRYALSEHPVNIFKVNVIRIDCNLITGAYQNEKPSHTIHEFFPRVPPGYKIIETPQNLIYLPIIPTRAIDHIKIEIFDQDGKLINFKSEVVTLRLHLRKV
jgi:hypothetical protein